MSVEEDQLEIEPNNSASSTIVLENTGSTDGTVQLSTEGTAEGWGLALSQEEVSVPAGGSESVQLDVDAPPDHGAGPGEVTVTVAGTMTDGTGQFSSSDEVQVTAAMPAPPAPPPDDTPWGLIVGATGTALVSIAAAGWYLNRDTTVESEVEIEVDPQTGVRSGGEQVLAVRLANASEDRRTANLTLEGVPTDWTGGLNREQIVLEPGDRDQVWVALKPSEGAQAVEDEFTLRVDFAEELVLPDSVQLPLRVDEEELDPHDPSRTLVAPVGARAVRGAGSPEPDTEE